MGTRQWHGVLYRCVRELLFLAGGCLVGVAALWLSAFLSGVALFFSIAFGLELMVSWIERWAGALDRVKFAVIIAPYLFFLVYRIARGYGVPGGSGSQRRRGGG
ncbi:MAG TPA: hypothetical protein HPP83_07525 [Candidatus Hydrogenedentes bacterium]|nr:hypothetical protein [Candidatus Hydrogenedentota bacterium]